MNCFNFHAKTKKGSLYLLRLNSSWPIHNFLLISVYVNVYTSTGELKKNETKCETKTLNENLYENYLLKKKKHEKLHEFFV